MFEIILSGGLFILGLAVLVTSARFLVRGAISLSRILGLSPWFVGLVIVGIGTSVPELAINIASTFKGSGVGLASLIGSNTFNILGILGITALITPAFLKREWVYRDLFINLGAVAIAALFIISSPFGGGSEISRVEGLILFALFLTWVVNAFLSRTKDVPGIGEEVFAVSTSVFFVIIGIVGVFFGGEWVVSGAETIALSAGVSAELVGFTIVAIGTSLPELSVSLVAAIRKQSGLAVGNIIGSNVFDMLGILGIASLLRPITIAENIQFDIFATLGAVILAILTSICIGRCWYISRKEGLLLLFAYLGYIAFLLLR